MTVQTELLAVNNSRDMEILYLCPNGALTEHRGGGGGVNCTASELVPDTETFNVLEIVRDVIVYQPYLYYQAQTPAKS